MGSASGERCRRDTLGPSRYSRGWAQLRVSWHYHRVIGCPRSIQCSMLRKYTPDQSHVVDWGELFVDVDETFKEGPVPILDSRDQVLRRKIVRLVKVLWQHRGMEEATWEREDTMRIRNPL